MSPDALTETPCAEVTVLADILKRSVTKYGSENAMGWRDLIRMVPEEKEVTKMIGGKEVKEKKTWQFFEMSDYKYWTYIEVGAVVAKVASALVATGHSKDTIFNIYSATSPRWQVMANGESLSLTPSLAARPVRWVEAGLDRDFGKMTEPRSCSLCRSKYYFCDCL